jgi:hypothetical protein
VKKILHSHCKGEQLQGPEKKKNSSPVAKAKKMEGKKIIIHHDFCKDV